jgi:hypothetical protein
MGHDLAAAALQLPRAAADPLADAAARRVPGGEGVVTGRVWLVPVAWALWVGVLATVLAIWSGDEVSYALLGGAALFALTVMGGFALSQSPRTERAVNETSAAPLLLAAGVTLVINGIAFGLWLGLIGAELLAFGLFLLLRDRRRAS